MQNDLSELIDRIELCRVRGRDIERKVTDLARSSIACWVQHGAQSRAGEVKAKLLAHPPLSLRQEVGMLVNEQRTILDGLTSVLATRNGHNDVRGVYFPITKTKEVFNDKHTTSKFRKLSDAQIRTIETFKPWLPSAKDPEDGNRLLFQLHEADRVRKHQNLLRWSCLGGVHPTGDGYIGTLQTHGVIFSEIEKEEHLAFFSDVTCQLVATFTMIYDGPPALHGRPVAPLLSHFCDAISEIVQAFA